MKRILITGASGNVGAATLEALLETPMAVSVSAAVRNVEKERTGFERRGIPVVHFDFEEPATFLPALQSCDILFLLRPPQLADVKKYFTPLIAAAVQAHVQHIAFLSVQGAEANRFIPHHKIEKRIVANGIPYTFLRPAYFMQNFTTSLRNDIVQKNRIFLPAGNAAFTLVDVRDVGRAAAAVLLHTEAHLNKAYTLTSKDRLTFAEMAVQLTAGLGRKIQFISPSLLSFYFAKRREGMPSVLIGVMVMLHYLPRFSAPPALSNDIERLTGGSPSAFRQFIADHKAQLTL